MEPANQNDATYTLTYFRSGQLSFFVSYEGEDLPPDASKILQDEIVKFLKPQYASAELTAHPVISFPAVQEEIEPDKEYDHSSLQSDDSRRSKIKILPRPASSLLVYDVKNVNVVNPIEFFELIIQLEKGLRELSPFVGFTLEAVSPNWLVSGADDQSGTGGPGSRPVPYRDAPHQAPYWFADLPDIVKTSEQGKSVDVYILDTVPTQQTLEEAYNNEHNNHPLIHSLLRPGGPLRDDQNNWRIISYPGSAQFEALRARGHDYKMTDHGLFAAGIVHTIAPCANIYLVQVLNDYGVGDVESVAEGLRRVHELIKQNRSGQEPRLAVVNCSLTFNLPIDENGLHRWADPGKMGDCFDDRYLRDYRTLEQKIYEKLKNDASWREQQRLSLEHPCQNIYAENSRVVAAAGNDWRPEFRDNRPQARYPAAFNSVQGVGALPKEKKVAKNGKRKTASYSNRADQPEYIGVTTFGGEPGEGNGVLGLYLGEFPFGEANHTKWAWWAGTSFATPIFSGIVAAVLSGQSTPTGDPKLDHPVAAQAAIKILNEPIRKIIKQSETVTDEDVLDVTQGPPPP